MYKQKSMRRMLFFVILISSLAAKSQTVLPLNFMDYIQRSTFGNNNYFMTGASAKKWFFTSYSAISTSLNFFNGGSATVVAAPVGLQLNRRLNNNFYAFAGVSVAPAYINFNGFPSYSINKMYQSNSVFNPNSFGVYSRAELGLMYINDARTFSVSGSVGVQRSSYLMIPYQQMNTAKSNRVTTLHK